MADSVLNKDLQDVCANFSASFEFLNKEIERNALNETLNETLALTDELQTLTEIVNADTQVSLNMHIRCLNRCPCSVSILRCLMLLLKLLPKDALK